MEVLGRAIELEKEGKSIIHMEIGEPDFPTPKKITEAGIASLRGGDTHYTDSRGILELRSSIADYYRSLSRASSGPLFSRRITGR